MTDIAPVNMTKYVIISPVRDEERYIVETIRSVVRQTVRPTEWIIVDDGSTDRTAGIIDQTARQFRWIRALHRPDRGRRVAGSGVMEAFYEGYHSLGSTDWEFVVKLDGDVGLPADYFERCFERFGDDPQLGMCGGVMFRVENGEASQEMHPRFHVRGPIKLYRRPCWEAIGGLVKAPGWDTIDELKANMSGWHTRSFPDLRVMHYRPTGAAEGAWKDGVKNGKADYITGYHPLFMLAKCVRRLFHKPYVIEAVAHAYGFAIGYATRTPQVQDRELIRYIRSQQIRRLFWMESIWK